LNWSVAFSVPSGAIAMSLLTKYLGLSASHNDVVAEGAENVQTATEFLQQVAEKLPDVGEALASLDGGWLGDAVGGSLPWVSAAGDVIGDVIPPVKVALNLLKRVSQETDPNALGLLAVSLGYQHAVAEAVKEIEADHARRALILRTIRPRAIQREITVTAPEQPDDFAGFRLASALSHKLVRGADAALQAVAEAAGYPEALRRLLLEGVHRRFASTFAIIIAEGKQSGKFDPLFRLLSLDPRLPAAFAAVQRHIDYQLWRLSEATALGTAGPMSVRLPLGKLYVPLDCGVLSWKDARELSSVRRGVQVRESPFDETHGGRTELVAEVMRLIGEPAFNDAIVLEGVAGAGKSTSTLYLCKVLREAGLQPLRIRMRDLNLEPRLSLFDDIAVALVRNSGDDQFDSKAGPRASAGDIDLSVLLEEAVPFASATICPFIIILDGWDEISVSASEGYRVKIEKTLDAVRRHLLESGRSHRIRVILTGRPSEDMKEAKFLREATPILTLRPFTRTQLRTFVAKLLAYRKREPTTVSRTVLATRTRALLKQYQEDMGGEVGKSESILGLPLLALLAVWLVLSDQDAPGDVLTNRTSLYRRLVDLTCLYGGSVEAVPSAPRLIGLELRDLLARTAAAMTLRGTEYISYEELRLRLEASGLHDADSVMQRAGTSDQVDKLMLSFFFNAGGRAHGCEFLHKSFREYLFAEAVVAALKAFPENGSKLPGRTPYWKDFEASDPRHAVAMQLALLLGPQWLSADVARHLDWLLAWEIGRSVREVPDWRDRHETPSIALTHWQAVRDVLADLWDWWGEGVHLRPQPMRQRGTGTLDFNNPSSVDLAEEIVPAALGAYALPEPVRTTTLDAHLGDALFRLNCRVHFEINKATGWLDRLEGVGPRPPTELWGLALIATAARHYQSEMLDGMRKRVFFHPADHFDAYAARINAAGWRPDGPFPWRLKVDGVDFSEAKFTGITFFEFSARACNFTKTGFFACLLHMSSFVKSYLKSTSFFISTMNGCDFSDSDGNEVNLLGSAIRYDEKSEVSKISWKQNFPHELFRFPQIGLASRRS
jgi:hypothetical protein